MSIKTITADELRRMNGQEGLILQGCGGDPQEWLDGINNLLTKEGIGMALKTEPTEDNSMDLQIRIAEIDAEFKAMLAKISTETVDAFDEEKAKQLMDEKVALQQQLADIQNGQLEREQNESRLNDIYTILDGLKNRPMEYDEQIVRQLLECITVDSKERITVIFTGGLKVVQSLID